MKRDTSNSSKKRATSDLPEKSRSRSSGSRPKMEVSLTPSPATPTSGGWHISITWEGRPISKKSSQRIIMQGKRRIIIYSKAYQEIKKTVIPQLTALSSSRSLSEAVGEVDHLGSPGCKIAVRAHLYAGKGIEPDLSGALETVGDVLQEAGLIENDRWIKSWDGSRVLTIDKDHPRTELVITKFTEGQ